ncbi:rod shape-determining protein MreC [Lentisphaerota bacterium WC36G]|nr:rod shape-determining protein MreC [Lentisphaerae bacterium WC36]
MHLTRKTKRLFTIVTLIAIVSSLLLFFGVFKNFSYKVSNFYYWAISGFGFFEEEATIRSSSYKSRRELSQELTELQLKYHKLLVLKSINESLLSENEQLRSLLKLKKFSQFSAVTAGVYVKNPVFGSEFFSIDKGAAHGIKLGALAVVVTEVKGENKVVVVGRVSEIANRTAVVRTILSPQTKLSVKLANSGAVGVITQGYRQQSSFISLVNYLPKKSIFEKGELVYTSGLSSFTPGGILVGELTSNIGVSRTLNETTYEQIECQIYAPLEKIKFVVILNRQ